MKNVSVIVPVYNGSKWTESIKYSLQGNSDCIAEVIFINDGSIDDFNLLIDSIATSIKIPIIRLYTSGNKGPAFARNMGINSCGHRYIAFLDCDDIWLQDSLSKRVNILDADEEVCFSYSSLQYISESGATLNQYYLPKITSLDMLLVTNYLITSSIVLRRNNLNGLRFPLTKHEDYCFWLNLLAQSGSFAIGSDEVGVMYRIVQNSVSANKQKSALWHWGVLKSSGLPFFLRVLLFLTYSLNGVMKRKFNANSPIFLRVDKLTRAWLKIKPIKIID
jgi:teichuronic acid biosynthesis glycosyltransferase TuaG